jgi:hypothetical protein
MMTPSPTSTMPATILTFSGNCAKTRSERALNDSCTGLAKYVVSALLLVLVILLFRSRNPITHMWFAVWAAEVLISCSLVCTLSGLGIDFLHDYQTPLVDGVLPACMGLCTLGLWALSGAILMPSPKSRCEHCGMGKCFRRR